MEGVMDLRKIVALAKRSIDETTEPYAKRRKVADDINPALKELYKEPYYEFKKRLKTIIN